MSLHPSTDIIANAQTFFAHEQNEANLTRLLRAISNLLQEGAEILIPTAEATAAPGQLLLQTQTAADGQQYLTAYSSQETYALGTACPVISRPLVNYFEVSLQMPGIAGIVFNPASPAPFNVQSKMIKELLHTTEQSKQKNALSVWRGDITTLNCDAIVNAANSTLLGGGGVDGAIHAAAGPELLEECRELQGCATGEAKITFGYQLPATYVIHTVGPIYNGKTTQRFELADCYHNSLELARAHHLHSIAFPAISAGAYGYPAEEAARIALLTCTEWLNAHADYGMQVILTCYNSTVYKIYQELVAQARRGEL